MRCRRSGTAAGDRARPQERSLKHVSFVGSFPRADFRIDPQLPEVAFVGRSNVGKSALINALVGRKAIARTSKSPGKTRDCNVFDVGHKLYLVDLPGYGYARVSKGERRRFGRLIEQYVARREEAVGIVWLLDIRHAPSAEDHHMAQLLAARKMPIIIALTKADKVSATQRADRVAAIVGAFDLPADQAIVTSAATGLGIDDLRESVLAAAEN